MRDLQSTSVDVGQGHALFDHRHFILGADFAGAARAGPFGLGDLVVLPRLRNQFQGDNRVLPRHLNPHRSIDLPRKGPLFSA